MITANVLIQSPDAGSFQFSHMPAILAPEHYTRWLSDEPDPCDVMRPFPAGLMRMWPISTRVNKPENDDPSIIDPIELASDAG